MVSGRQVGAGDRHRRRNRLGVYSVAGLMCQRSEPQTCQGSAANHSTCTTAWHQWCKRRELRDPRQCWRRAMHGQTELRVIGILVILDAVLRDDISHWAAVDSKQQRAKHRSKCSTYGPNNCNSSVPSSPVNLPEIWAEPGKN